MPEWLQEIKTKIKNRGRRPRFFISRSLFPVITRARFVFYLNKCQWKPTSFNCFHVSFLSDSTCLSTPTPRQTLRVELSRSRFEASQELLCFQMPSCPFLSIDRQCTDRYSVQPLTIPFFVLLWPSLYLLFLLVPSVFISVSSIHSWSRVRLWACASWKVIVLVVFLASLRKKRLLFLRRPSPIRPSRRRSFGLAFWASLPARRAWQLILLRSRKNPLLVFWKIFTARYKRKKGRSTSEPATWLHKELFSVNWTASTAEWMFTPRHSIGRTSSWTQLWRRRSGRVERKLSPTERAFRTLTGRNWRRAFQTFWRRWTSRNCLSMSGSTQLSSTAWWMQLDRNGTTSPSTFRLRRQKSATEGESQAQDKRRSCKLSLHKTSRTLGTLPKKAVFYKRFFIPLEVFYTGYYTK